MAWAHWREDEGFCNIDELSAVGMTHLELQMKKESSKRTVQVIAVSSSFLTLNLKTIAPQCLLDI